MIKFSLRAFVALFIFLSVSSVYAHNKVVVIPLGEDCTLAPIEYVMQYNGPGDRPSSFTRLDIDGTFYDGVLTYNTTFLDAYKSSSSPTPTPPLWGNNALAEALQTALVAALNADEILPLLDTTIHLPTENKRGTSFLFGVYGYRILQRAPNEDGMRPGEPYNARAPFDFNGQAGVGNDRTALLTSLHKSCM
ncbi:MAG: hypothetical protein ACJAUP_002067 [Cellvibrionaceae bacterium]|jgi:hypothetical protein